MECNIFGLEGKFSKVKEKVNVMEDEVVRMKKSFQKEMEVKFATGIHKNFDKKSKKKVVQEK